jgi:hypothetical protein
MVGLSEIDTLTADKRAAALAGIGGMLSRVVPEETLLTGHVSATDPAVFPTTEQQVHTAGVEGLEVRSTASATPALEYPLVTTGAAPTQAVRALEDAFAADAGQKVLRDAGFRTPEDPSPVIAGGPPAAALSAEATPEQAEAAEQM